MDLPLVFQRHLVHLSEVGYCVRVTDGKGGGSAPCPRAHLGLASLLVSFLASISAQVVITQCNLQVPLNCQVFLEVFKHQLLQGWV